MSEYIKDRKLYTDLINDWNKLPNFIDHFEKEINRNTDNILDLIMSEWDDDVDEVVTQLTSEDLVDDVE